MGTQNTVGTPQLETTSISPVAPRFERSSLRGCKRVFNVTKFDCNLAKKQMVCCILVVNLQDCFIYFPDIVQCRLKHQDGLRA
jgi:hypothetical protein